MATSYATKQDGIDYYFEVMKHIDRMSEGLKEGLAVGEVNTKPLTGYYRQIIHLENILVPFLDATYYRKKGEIERRIPSYAKTWSPQMEQQMGYFIAISDLLKLLVIYAYNAGVLKIKIRKDLNVGEGIFD